MNEWIKQHSWPLAIALIGIVGTYSVYGYRITAIEDKNKEQDAEIQVLTTQQTQVQIQLAQLLAGMEYIKASLDRVLGQ